ncbi:LPS export ABC transporter periplasmic protein LptC [uncultured Hymenobacter sp.]|uniref:LPS export ABC transporter periplasmic protein LptC n=1 Tax=uncultured Hymenobacter sp. TaxID=170016 RepID=UPI0035CB266A
MRTFRLMCLLPTRAASLLLLASLWAASCKKSEPQVKAPVKYSGPLLESTNVNTLFSDSAKLQVKYTAPLEQQFENGDQLYPKGLRVTFFDKSGLKVVNTLSGKYCKFEKVKNLYTMRGNVQVNNEEKKQRMYTEELFYDKQKNLVYTDSATFAQFVTPTDSLTGYGLIYNMTTSRYLFKRPAGQFIVEAASNPQ